MCTPCLYNSVMTFLLIRNVSIWNSVMIVTNLQENCQKWQYYNGSEALHNLYLSVVNIFQKWWHARVSKFFLTFRRMRLLKADDIPIFNLQENNRNIIMPSLIQQQPSPQQNNTHLTHPKWQPLVKVFTHNARLKLNFLWIRVDKLFKSCVPN